STARASSAPATPRSAKALSTKALPTCPIRPPRAPGRGMCTISTTLIEPTGVQPLRSDPASASQNVRRGSSRRHHWAKAASNPGSSTGPPARSSSQARRSPARAASSRSSATRTTRSGSATRAWPGVQGDQRQQGRPARPDLDVGARRRAHAAVEARRPAAVVLLTCGQRVLPVVPAPVALQPGVEVVPGQHLVTVALTGGEPVERDAERFELGGAGVDPALVGEVLGPAVEATAL